MITLKILDPAVVKAHLVKLSQHARGRLSQLIPTQLSAETLDKVPMLVLNDLVSYFDREMDHIVVAEPADLMLLIAATSAELGWLDTILARSATDRNAWEKDIVERLQWVFDYDAFSGWKHPTWNAYELVEKHQLRICPYCHTSHLNFHVDASKDMRPPLDHFYPRSRYPYLGTSLYNLIPSCYQCNSSVKGSKDPAAEALRHPFELGNKPVEFSLRLADGKRLPRNPAKVTAKQIMIKVAGIGACQASVDFFVLEQRYQWYTREMAELHSRALSYLDVGGTLAGLVGVKRFVYGFREEEARDYALGICIKDIADSLITSYSP